MGFERDADQPAERTYKSISGVRRERSLSDAVAYFDSAFPATGRLYQHSAADSSDLCAGVVPEFPAAGHCELAALGDLHGEQSDTSVGGNGGEPGGVHSGHVRRRALLFDQEYGAAEGARIAESGGGEFLF